MGPRMDPTNTPPQSLFNAPRNDAPLPQPGIVDEELTAGRR
jgi:hypothetical protein